MIKGLMKTNQVFINEIELSPVESQKVYNHSPDGFNWGYGGSGPAQLALALLLHYTDRDKAVFLYQRFKWEVIAVLPQSDFEMDEAVVKDWIKDNSGY